MENLKVGDYVKSLIDFRDLTSGREYQIIEITFYSGGVDYVTVIDDAGEYNDLFPCDFEKIPSDLSTVTTKDSGMLENLLQTYVEELNKDLLLKGLPPVDVNSDEGKDKLYHFIHKVSRQLTDKLMSEMLDTVIKQLPY